jgi:RNA polymerase sigma-70 factor, ECF subfamily
VIDSRSTGHMHGANLDPIAPARGPLALASARAAPTERLTVREMFAQHFDFVWRSVRRFGVPAASADDAAQEVFLVAMRKHHHIEPGREKAFLFGTAMRVASDVRRAAARRRDRVADADDPAARAVADADAPDAIVDQKRARELLERCIDAMTDDLRVVFVLFELEGMTAAAIAELLAIPAGTVASRLRRARDEFRDRVRKLAPSAESRDG